MSTRVLFSHHELRCTTQRMAVYDTLCQTDSHPTADELWRLVREVRKNVSRATVYNTLEVLAQVGLVRKMPGTGSDGCRFDARTAPHVHLSVPETGELVDVPEHLGRRLMATLPADLIQQVGDALGVDVESINIDLVGRRRLT